MDASVLDGPDMGAQDGLPLVPQVFERTVMVSQSFLPSCAAESHICLHHLLLVGLGLSHSGLVDDVPGEAVAL